MKKILIVNHKEKHCGIHQYGEDIYTALKKSQEFEFRYTECSSAQEFRRSFFRAPVPDAVIYNYYPATMPWLTWDITRDYGINYLHAKHIGIMHEVTQESVDKETRALFDYWLCPDPVLVENNPCCLKTKRLIPPYVNTQPVPKVPTIGSFGFGFADKGFENIVAEVQEEFEEAVIRFLMPQNDIVKLNFFNPEHNPVKTAQKCRELIVEPGIKLEISHTFLDKTGVLDFLAGNTINCFFYDPSKNKGISSVVDYALAVKRPIALTKSGMFRHMFGADIFIEDHPMEELIRNGITPLEPYFKEWSEKAFIGDYERILRRVLQ
jgi:hypothetical protein